MCVPVRFQRCRTEEEDVVPVEVLDFSEALQDDELRHDGDGLEVDAERPTNLDHVKPVPVAK